MSPPISEARLILIVGLIQFINIVDFMMVMPLGPDFAADLEMDLATIGWMGGSYMVAAAISGVLASTFLDRFDRRTCITFSLLGLALGTALGAIAWDLYSMLFARIVAGIFGGPATALATAIIADHIAPERRGSAMAKVMGAFSLAAILGVPLSLELARIGGWHMPFLVVALACLTVTFAAHRWLPSMRGHLTGATQTSGLRMIPVILSNPGTAHALAMNGLALFSGFLIIPNISAFVQFNLHYPRDQLGWLYFGGGLMSFFTMRLAGRAIDVWGIQLSSIVTSILVIAIIASGFYGVTPAIPVMMIFAGFMIAMSARGVVAATLTSLVPTAATRAGFMSLNHAVQSISSGMGALVSTLFLSAAPNGALIGMNNVALLAIVGAGFFPIQARLILRQIKQDDIR